MKKLFLISILTTTVVVLLQACGKTSPTGVMTTVTADGNHVTVTAVSDYIVRVANSADTTAAVMGAGIVLEQQPFAGKISTSAGVSTMTLPSGLSVTLDLTTGKVEFIADGKTLVTDNDVRESTDTTTILSIGLPGGGLLYGGGERGHAPTLNGDTLEMYNTQNYGYTEGDPRIKKMGVTIPLVVSSEGYGLLFDDYAAARLILNDPITYTTESMAPVSYYFIYGDKSLAGVVEHYTELTGRQPLAPLWSLGYITSKYGYHDAAEATGVIDTLQSMGYPVDGIVLDLYWYGEEENMGALKWDESKWPDPVGFLSDLKARGVNTVLITQPYVNKEGASDRYRELAEGGMFVVDSVGDVHDMTTWIADCSMIDVANPKTRQWLREIYKQLTDGGVGGWWGDLGDLETHPATAFHRDGEGKMIPARLYHNQYGNDWSSIIADLYADEYPETRLMSLMRGGTTGLQRFSVFPWSTDVSRSWGGLQPQIKIMISSGLSGLGYMHHDVGGFAIDATRPRDPELYVRWLQLGVFSPVLRTHAQQLPEPYRYPEYADLLADLVRERYRWLPYNYTLAYDNATTGAPLVRPLNFADPTMPAGLADQYLWGDEVMVAPVIEEGTESRQIVIPRGLWVDYNHPEVTYSGPDTVNYKAPLDIIPIFVRAGAILPQAHYQMANTGDYDTSRYNILFYPRGDGESTYSLFEDDLTSASSIAKNNFALLRFDTSFRGSAVTVNATVDGSYPELKEKTLTFSLPGIAPGTVTDLKIDGKDANVTGDDNATFTATLSAEKPLTVTFSLR